MDDGIADDANINIRSVGNLSWQENPPTYTIQTTNPLALEVKRAELVADIVDHIVNVFDRYRLEPIRRKKREVANMLIGQMVFSMGANLPDQVDDGMLFSKELIEAIPDSYIAEYLKCMRKSASAKTASSARAGVSMPTPASALTPPSMLTEAELKELVAKCDVKNKLVSALAELRICANYLNSHDVKVQLRKMGGNTIRFAVGKLITEEISAEVYDRLTAAFNKNIRSVDGVGDDSGGDFADMSADPAICAVILRYATLGSMGHQFGVPRHIKDALRDRLGANFELMASALNHHYDNYCSLFYDVERVFGSCGPINRVAPLEGVFISNPPYEEGILSTMLDVLTRALEVAEKNGKYLIFLFGLPDWRDDPPLPFYGKFRGSKYRMCEVKFQGMWENLTNGLLMPLKMTSYRCMMGTGHAKHDKHDNHASHGTSRGQPKNIFMDIVEEWRAMSVNPIVHQAKARGRGAPVRLQVAPAWRQVSPARR